MGHPSIINFRQRKINQMTDLTHPKLIIKRAAFAAAAALMLVIFPGPVALISSSASADGTSPTCSPVAPAPSGTTAPTGSAAGTFHYDSCTGLWENDHYTYNPSTRIYTALDQPNYVCNQSTWTWQNTNHWDYIASEGKYVQDTVNATPPASYGTCQAPVVVQSQPQPTSGSNPNGTSGDPSINANNSNNTNVTDNTSATLTNNIGSNATSGNVTANDNTTTGNAASGNASVAANIINQVNSSSSLNNGPPVATFTQNIDGNVNGDIIIDPNQLQPSSVSLNNTNNVTLNSQTSGTINNNVNLSAQSGDVTTSRNTSVGDATSGSASAMANVVNMLNSYVSAGQSFVGTININGNLNGNILMPPAFLSGLIASGAPSTTVNLSNTNSTTINDNAMTSIINNINSQATSGDVTAARNTEVGNATSGNASTNVTVYNLTGHQIIGANSLLVFVNVMGTWVGVIVNAPAGSHSALLGGGITADNTNNYNVNATTDNSINNNINVAATSGNVRSTENTQAGNATSGNASTSVSVANIVNDNLNLTGWFGILFINVFGSWYGNFGAAPMPATNTNSQSSGATGGSSNTSGPMFQFVPKASSDSTSGFTSGFDAGGAPVVTLTSTDVAKKVLADSTSIPASSLNKITPDKPTSGLSIIWPIVIGALVIAAILYLLATRASKVDSKR